MAQLDQLDPITRANLERATNVFLTACFADPGHRERLAAYRRQREAQQHADHHPGAGA